MILRKNEIRARRKGGHLVHVMQLTDTGHAPESGAICGDKPTKSRYSSMNRAGWYGMKDHVPVDCPKCLKIIESREAK